MKTTYDQSSKTTVAEMGWADIVRMTLPDGSLITVETDSVKGVVYLLMITTLGAKIPLVEVYGDLTTLPDASIHNITGELVNTFHNITLARAVFAGHAPVKK